MTKITPFLPIFGRSSKYRAKFDCFCHSGKLNIVECEDRRPNVKSQCLLRRKSKQVLLAVVPQPKPRPWPWLSHPPSTSAPSAAPRSSSPPSSSAPTRAMGAPSRRSMAKSPFTLGRRWRAGCHPRRRPPSCPLQLSLISQPHAALPADLRLRPVGPARHGLQRHRPTRTLRQRVRHPHPLWLHLLQRLRGRGALLPTPRGRPVVRRWHGRGLRRVLQHDNRNRLGQL